MTTSTVPEEATHRGEADDHYDAIVVGAGQAGLYALHLLRERGLRARAIDAASGVGGTWFWNRYPGARLHSESHSYQYFFSEEMLREWDWSEMFAGQPELERYYNRVADVLDLRKDIELETRIDSLTFDETRDEWIVATNTGKTYAAKVVIAATGLFSAAPIFPDAPGRERFKGEAHHTARWPKEPVSFAGKKVVVIGTGSTGVQVIPNAARDAERVTVLMRTPNWVVPLNNRPIPPEEMAEIRRGYPELLDWLNSTYGGFLHGFQPKTTKEYTEEELHALYEEQWRKTGFAKWFGMPADVLFDEDANTHYARFIEGKIRPRLDDPNVADMLIPKHPFGAKPVDCETLDYYEVYNQDNVDLVSVVDHPIQEFTETGIRLDDREIEADLIVFATGFEAFVGALNRIDITGLDGQKLKDTWADGPKTLMGVQVSGFPNLFLIGGPHGKGGHGNSPRCADQPLQWIADLARKVVNEGIRRIDPEPEAQEAWTEKVQSSAEGSILAKARSYLFSDNIPGRKRTYVAYSGALRDFVNGLEESAANGYQGFRIVR
ncbi:flavin-containing monooxygenase [Nocardia miyunensis]|uniref:flavin-containing monooxygenase n=1 Tax=Nocardia miyunensis TaxID=282684 RepID=UPI000831B069|nr:NAD(P)/FAD-dependent oxidoreductase [Nocardia miyunensis]